MYAYVGNDPVNYRDPMGLSRCFTIPIPGGGKTICSFSGPSGADGRLTALEDFENAGFADFYSGYAHDIDVETIKTTLKNDRKAFSQIVAGCLDAPGGTYESADEAAVQAARYAKYLQYSEQGNALVMNTEHTLEPTQMAHIHMVI